MMGRWRMKRRAMTVIAPMVRMRMAVAVRKRTLMIGHRRGK
jgi:hypothetical protein